MFNLPMEAFVDRSDGKSSPTAGSGRSTSSSSSSRSIDQRPTNRSTILPETGVSGPQTVPFLFGFSTLPGAQSVTGRCRLKVSKCIAHTHTRGTPPATFIIEHQFSHPWLRFACLRRARRRRVMYYPARNSLLGFCNIEQGNCCLAAGRQTHPTDRQGVKVFGNVSKRPPCFGNGRTLKQASNEPATCTFKDLAPPDPVEV